MRTPTLETIHANEALLNQAHALWKAINTAGCRHAAKYARIPYSIAQIENDPYLKRIEHALARADARYRRRVTTLATRQRKWRRLVITLGISISYLRERCPYCHHTTLYLEFDEWDLETGAPTKTGTHVYCRNEDESDTSHTDMPYVYWLPVQIRAARWAAAHVVIVDRDDQEALDDWNAGRPILVINPH